jgi:hypothetical protein
LAKFAVDGYIVRPKAFRPPFPRERPDGEPESSEDWAERHKVSGARRSKQTPSGAFWERQRIRPGATVGTWGISVREVEDEGSRLVDDSACPLPPGEDCPVGHTYLDQRFREEWRNEMLRLNLAGAATRRGRLYPPLH